MSLFDSIVDFTTNATKAIIHTAQLPLSLAEELVDEESNALEKNFEALENDLDRLLDEP